MQINVFGFPNLSSEFKIRKKKSQKNKRVDMQKSKGVEGYKGSGEAKQKGRTAEGWKSRGIAWGVR